MTRVIGKIISVRGHPTSPEPRDSVAIRYMLEGKKGTAVKVVAPETYAVGDSVHLDVSSTTTHTRVEIVKAIDEEKS